VPDKYVRDKSQYKPLGQELEALGTTDGSEEDGQIVMYALWAPEESSITYVTDGFVVDGKFETGTVTNNASNPVTYQFQELGVTKNVTIHAPSIPGYTFKGWYMYQNEGKNANWGFDFEPVYKDDTSDKTYANLNYAEMNDQYWEANADGEKVVDMGNTNFGDITLIPVFEPSRANLTISKTVDGQADEGQKFIFTIHGEPDRVGEPEVNMEVALSAGQNLTVTELPVGEYTVTELTDWSWRYELTGVMIDNTPVVAANGSVDIQLTTAGKSVTFTNKRENPYWLSDDCYARNWWKDESEIEVSDKDDILNPEPDTGDDA